MFLLFDVRQISKNCKQKKMQEKNFSHPFSLKELCLNHDFVKPKQQIFLISLTNGERFLFPQHSK